MGLLSSLFGGNKTNESQQEKKDKKNFEILKYDGIRARSMRQLPYAIKCLEQATAIKEDIEALQYLAATYAESERLDDARITLDKVLNIAPDNVESLISLANICFIQEDYESMDNACQKAIKADEKNIMAYFLAARAARGMNNEIQAIVMLTKAIAQDETFTTALQLRAEVLWGMRQANDALADIEAILTQNAEDEDALLLKARIMAATGQADEALALLDKVSEINPFNEKTYLLKGELLSEQKEMGKAIDVYTEAIELMPQNAKFYQARGRIKLVQGDKDGSVEDMKKAIELNPENEKLINGNFDNFNKGTNNVGIY